MRKTDTSYDTSYVALANKKVPGQFLGLRSVSHLPVRAADLKPCARSGASTPRGNGASHRPHAPAADAREVREFVSA